MISLVLAAAIFSDSFESGDVCRWGDGCPEIQMAAPGPGWWEVALEVCNAVGCDTETKWLWVSDPVTEGICCVEGLQVVVQGTTAEDIDFYRTTWTVAECDEFDGDHQGVGTGIADGCPEPPEPVLPPSFGPNCAFGYCALFAGESLEFIIQNLVGPYRYGFENTSETACATGAPVAQLITAHQYLMAGTYWPCIQGKDLAGVDVTLISGRSVLVIE